MIDSSNSPHILFEDVFFRYWKNGNWIVQDLNLSINPGEWVAIVGGNGSGKSSLVKLMNGLLMPTVGKVLVEGEVIDTANIRKIRQLVGVVFQNPEEQIVGYTVEEDIAFGLQNLGFPRDEMIWRVDCVLRMLQMESLRKRPVRSLSGGQKQLVTIAGILVMHPKIIIFDEAVSMLDPTYAAIIHEVMSKLHHKGITIVQVTHDPEDTLRADRVLVLNSGRITYDGNVITLMKQPYILEAAQTLPPFLVRFNQAIRDKGLNLPEYCGSEKELAKYIWESISAK